MDISDASEESFYRRPTEDEILDAQNAAKAARAEALEIEGSLLLDGSGWGEAPPERTLTWHVERLERDAARFLRMMPPAVVLL